MPEYLAPGVYIEETEIGRKPIEAVATSTAIFISDTSRGPVEPRQMRSITSCYEYLRYFGKLLASGKFMPYAVKGFVDNGGRACCIMRTVGANGQSPDQWTSSSA